MESKLFIVSASSGAGKTTLVNAVVERMRIQCPIERVITYTSRALRPDEKDGQDYHFITGQKFKQHIEQGFFLEWSTAYGAYYGSPRHILDEVKAGQPRIMILDRAGAKQVLTQEDQVVLIWVDAGNIQRLKERLAIRQTEDVAQIEQRLVLAREEAACKQREQLYHYHILNDNFERAINQFIDIIRCELEDNVATQLQQNSSKTQCLQ